MKNFMRVIDAICTFIGVAALIAMVVMGVIIGTYVFNDPYLFCEEIKGCLMGISGMAIICWIIISIKVGLFYKNIISSVG